MKVNLKTCVSKIEIGALDSRYVYTVGADPVSIPLNFSISTDCGFTLKFYDLSSSQTITHVQDATTLA